MKRTISAIFALCMLSASMAFAAVSDTTIMGVSFKKMTACSDFDQIRVSVNQSSAAVNVILMNDIDCSSISSFSPIGVSEEKSFNGTFDGNGKTISGLKITTSSTNYVGLFGIIGPTGVVKNVTISKSAVSGVKAKYAGLLVGLNYGLVTNCEVDASSSVNAPNSNDVGGIAGRNGGYGTMSGCTNRASVTGGEYVGGIAGACTGAIDNSVNYGTVTGGTAAGGIVGSSRYRDAGTLYSGRDSVFVPGRIALCQNVGAVSGESYAGGIVGLNKNGTIDNSRNDGSVKANNTYLSKGIAGGVVGYSYFDNSKSYSKSDYTASITNSFSTTDNVTGYTKGGVVGKVENSSSTKTYSTVKNCYYDSEKLTGVNAVGSSSSSTVTSVSGKATADMFANETFVDLLNGGSTYTAWLFDLGDYPVINFGANHGSFKIVFILNGSVYYDGTTVGGKLAGSVVNPTTAGFKGWMDNNVMYTTAEANARVYTKSVVYHGVLKKLYNITFKTDYGADLGTKVFEEGSMVYYYDEDRDSEIPADYETEAATYKFAKWDRAFEVAAKDTFYTAKFDMIPKAFEVKFFVFDKQYGETQSVKNGESAVAPEDPSVEGYRFRGWEEDFSKVTAALDVHAKMVELVNVCFEFENVSKECIDVPADSTIEDLPELPENEEFTCDAWLINGVVPESAINVTDIETIKARCSTKSYDVKFIVLDKQYGETQSVKYGDAATAPADPSVEGYRFRGWEEDFSKITAALDVHAKMVELVNVCFEFENVSKNCIDVPADSTIEDLPELPENEEFTCDAWLINGVVPESAINVTDIESIKARCSVKKYEVNFYLFSKTDKAYDSQLVEYGKDALVPADPEVEGYRFRGWEGNYTAIQHNEDVMAKMVKLVDVCFAFENVSNECVTVPADTTIELPEIPENPEFSCDAWLVNGEVATGSIVVADVESIKARCSTKSYDVKFIVLNDQYGETQSVKYGAAATAPADPDVAGYRFRGWEEDFSNITANLDVHAKMVELVNVCFEFENVSKNCIDVPADSTIEELPEIPENEEFTCDAWLINGVVPESAIKVTDIESIKARCSVKKYEVNFYLFSKTDKAYDSQLVEYGKDALVPADPAVEGFRFRGWEGNYTAIQHNEDVMAKMVKLVDVCFAFETVSNECITVPADTTIELPEVPENQEFTCDAWLVNGEIATGSIAVADVESIKAQCSVKSYNVKFFVLNDQYGDAQSVKYGDAAAKPEDPAVEGYRFNSWIEDFSRITDNLDVHADMSKLTELCFAFEGANVKCETVPVDTLVKDVEFPELPKTDSLSCSEWTVKLVDGAVAGEDGATAGQVAGIEAKCYVNTFAVRFFINGDQEGETQEVAYGASAVAPAVSVPGYRFDGWDSDYRRIIRPLNVNAIMTKLTNICFEFAGTEDCREVRADSTIKDLPELPGNDSLTCDAWLINGVVATGAVRIEDIKKIEARCTVNEFEVNFFVLDEKYGETQSVKYGSAATKPEDPAVDGYFFESWDKDFSRITTKLDVNAVMKPIVCYEFAGANIKCDTVAIDAEIELPELPGNDSLTCDAWLVNGEVAEGSVAAAGIKSVVARCSVNEFEVKFFAEDEQVGKTQKVAYGSAATAPEAPEVANKRFVKWEGDYSRITADTRIDADYVEIDSVLVIVHGEAIDTIVVAKGETVKYVLPKVKDSKDSTFTGWKVNDDVKKAGEKIKVAYGDKIVAGFDEVQSISSTRVAANTIARPIEGGVQISGVRAGTLIAVFDLNGHMVAQKRASNAVETLKIENRGAYLVRIGTQAQRVTVR